MRNRLFFAIPLGLLILVGFLLPVRPYMAVATVAYALLWTGLLLRKNRRIHVPLMATGIFLDLLIVAILEFERNAIKTAISFTLSPLQQAHVLVSSVALVLYFPTIYFGLRRFLNRGDLRERELHLGFAKSAFVFRSLGFLLMFSLFWLKSKN
jgi:hypothetical protein